MSQKVEKVHQGGGSQYKQECLKFEFGHLKTHGGSQFFFGSSHTGIEWDKSVAEIIITTFVFLGHHRGYPPYGPLKKWCLPKMVSYDCS